MQTALRHTHLLSVLLFLLIYLVKTFLLVTNKNEALAKFVKASKVLEMIISVLFLGTGVYLLTIVGATKLIIIKIVMVLASIPIAIIGFKKSNKILAVIALLLIIGAYGLGEVNKKKVEKQTLSASANGEEVYGVYCERCHGKGGLNGAMGLDLTTTKFDHIAIIERIKNGSGSMPPFKDVLSEQELNAVADYIGCLIQAENKKP